MLMNLATCGAMAMVYIPLELDKSAGVADHCNYVKRTCDVCEPLVVAERAQFLNAAFRLVVFLTDARSDDYPRSLTIF